MDCVSKDQLVLLRYYLELDEVVPPYYILHCLPAILPTACCLYSMLAIINWSHTHFYDNNTLLSHTGCSWWLRHEAVECQAVSSILSVCQATSVPSGCGFNKTGRVPSTGWPHPLENSNKTRDTIGTRLEVWFRVVPMVTVVSRVYRSKVCFVEVYSRTRIIGWDRCGCG